LDQLGARESDAAAVKGGRRPQRPPTCDILRAIARSFDPIGSVGLGGKSGREDLNLRPPAPKAGALARLRHAPIGIFLFWQLLWRLGRPYTLRGMREIISSIEGEFRRYRKLGEDAMRQLGADELSARGAEGTNSIVILVWHVSGNLKSRFTDFLTSDGEKPWRKRDEEFAARSVSRDEVFEKWNDGWIVLLDTLRTLTDEDLTKTVVIRGESFKAHEALLRLMAHAAYHVGQIVYVAKAIRGGDWKWLSIPPGTSEEYNRKPTGQRPPD
jgi:uncharacterized damage-inducible protein DinB